METYDDSVGVQTLGTLGVDATTRDVLYQAPGTGVLTETGVTVNKDWHHYQIRLDFLADMYSTSVDYASVTAQPIAFIDGSSNTFTDADIAAFAAASDAASQHQTETAFVDNFVIVAISLGDLDFDGTVDAADAGIMFADWEGSGESDLNIDGMVDAADAGLMFEKSTGDTTTVPEPSTALLGALAMVGLMLRRRPASSGSFNFDADIPDFLLALESN